MKAGSATVLQGVTEKSNVQPTIEMSRLIEINRSYELASKLLKDLQDPTELSKLLTYRISSPELPSVV